MTENEDMYINLVLGDDGVFHLKKEPFTTVEVETEEDFEHLKKAVALYCKYGEVLTKAHGPLVDMNDIDEVLECAHTVSDGEYCGYDTGDVRRGLEAILKGAVVIQASDEPVRNIRIKVRPDIGDAYQIIIPFNPEKDGDAGDYVEAWLNDHAINVAEYEIFECIER